MIFSFVSVFGFLAPGHCTYPPRSTRRSRAKFQGELAHGGQKEPGPNPEALSLAPPPLPTKMSMSRAVHVLMSEGHGKLLASTPGYFRLLCSTTGTRGTHIRSSFKPPAAETAVPACYNFARFGLRESLHTPKSPKTCTVLPTYHCTSSCTVLCKTRTGRTTHGRLRQYCSTVPSAKYDRLGQIGVPIAQTSIPDSLDSMMIFSMRILLDILCQLKHRRVHINTDFMTS